MSDERASYDRLAEMGFPLVRGIVPGSKAYIVRGRDGSATIWTTRWEGDTEGSFFGLTALGVDQLIAELQGPPGSGDIRARDAHPAGKGGRDDT